MILRSIAFAAAIAAAIQCFTVGFLAPYLPREVCRPQVRESRTLSLPAAKRLRVHNADGAVRIAPAPDGDVQVLADLRAYTARREDQAAARAYLDTLVQAEEEGDTLTVRTEHGARPEALDLRVDYAIRVPVGTEVRIEGINGNVEVGRGAGPVTVTGSNTDVHIDAPGGPVRVETTNGRIRLYDAPAGASLVTMNGSIYVHMMGGALSADTTNGSIVATLMNKDIVSCELNATNGGVTLAMPDGCPATVNASTLSGVVRSDFPVAPASTPDERRRLEGTIGGGGVDLSLHSLNGNIWLTRRAS